MNTLRRIAETTKLITNLPGEAILRGLQGWRQQELEEEEVIERKEEDMVQKAMQEPFFVLDDIRVTLVDGVITPGLTLKEADQGD